MGIGMGNKKGLKRGGERPGMILPGRKRGQTWDQSNTTPV